MKVAVVGDCDVGKSSLVSRFVNREKLPTLTHTVGVDCTITSLSLFQRVHRVKFYDITGSDYYEGLYEQYMLNANIIVVVYDINKYKSFVRAKTLVEKIQGIHNEEFPIILVGNKIDEIPRRRVTTATALGYIKSHSNVFFIETSAKNNVNTKECLRMIVTEGSRNSNATLSNVQKEEEAPSSCVIV